MASMEEEFFSLLQDTITFAKKQKGNLFVAKESFPEFYGLAEKVLHLEESKEEKFFTTPIKQPVLPFQEKSKGIKEALKEEALKLEEKKKKEASLPSVFEELSDKIRVLVPSIKIIKEVPSDAKAKRNAHLFDKLKLDTDVVILTSNKEAIEENFLDNLILAISNRLASAKKLDIHELKEEDFKEMLSASDVKLFICTPDVFSFAYFIKHVKKIPKDNSFYLLHIPLLALEPFPHYAQDLTKKKQLWNRLCQIVKTPLSAS